MNDSLVIPQHYQRWAHFVILRSPLIPLFDPNWVGKLIINDTMGYKPRIGCDVFHVDPWSDGLKKSGVINPCDMRVRSSNDQTSRTCACISNDTELHQCSRPTFVYPLCFRRKVIPKEPHHERETKVSGNSILYCFSFEEPPERLFTGTLSDTDVYLLRVYIDLAYKTASMHPLFQLRSWVGPGNKAYEVIKMFSVEFMVRFTASINHLQICYPDLRMGQFYPYKLCHILQALGVQIEKFSDKLYNFPLLGGIDTNRPYDKPYCEIQEIARYHESPMTGSVLKLWFEWTAAGHSIADYEYARYKIYKANHSFASKIPFKFQCPHRALIIRFIIFAESKRGISTRKMVDYLDMFLQFNGNKELTWLVPRLQVVMNRLFAEDDYSEFEQYPMDQLFHHLLQKPS